MPEALHAGALPEHEAQSPPLTPHAESAAVPVPAEHWPLPQQPPLQVPVQAVPHVPFTHAWFAGHWLSELQPHCSFDRHAGALCAQLAQTLPPEPHALAVVPPTQIPVVAGGVISKHRRARPLEEHVVAHAAGGGAARDVGGASGRDVHPHAPPKPPANATHALPTLAPAQLVHAPPLLPHAVGTIPPAQTPNAPPSAPAQQPPLHPCDALHAVVHALVFRSQACPWGQSLAALHPQVPELAMQAAPAARATQLEHNAPRAPHAVDVSGEAHVVPLQQVPLHGWLLEQSAVQVCVATSQACPLGHELAAEHPAPSVATASGSIASTSGDEASVSSASEPASGSVRSGSELPSGERAPVDDRAVRPGVGRRAILQPVEPERLRAPREEGADREESAPQLLQRAHRRCPSPADEQSGCPILERI